VEAIEAFRLFVDQAVEQFLPLPSPIFGDTNSKAITCIKYKMGD
jgi:hypothetical protein